MTALILLYFASVPAWLFLIFWCIASYGTALIIIAIAWLCIGALGK